MGWITCLHRLRIQVEIWKFYKEKGYLFPLKRGSFRNKLQVTTGEQISGTGKL